MTQHANTQTKFELIDIEKKSREALSQEMLSFIDQVLKTDPSPEGQLIAVLHKLQELYGYLPREQLDAVSQLMHIPSAKISGVASFYHYFHLEPRGKFIISVCLGTACYVKGAESLLEKFQQELGIKIGETTKDGLFTLEEARCIGACALAPVVKVGDDVYPELTPDRIPAIIESYIKKASEK